MLTDDGSGELRCNVGYEADSIRTYRVVSRLGVLLNLRMNRMVDMGSSGRGMLSVFRSALPFRKLSSVPPRSLGIGVLQVSDVCLLLGLGSRIQI